MNSGSPYSRGAVDTSLLALRLAAGTIMAAHGAQKLFGMFGAPGMEPVVASLGTVLGYLVAIGECFGGLGMIVGFLTRFSAASNIVIMIGAIAMAHGANGFFLDKGGFEYNLALIGLMIPIVMLGAGSYAIGRFLPLPKAAGTDRPITALE